MDATMQSTNQLSIKTNIKKL